MLFGPSYPSSVVASKIINYLNSSWFGDIAQFIASSRLGLQIKGVPNGRPTVQEFGATSGERYADISLSGVVS